MSEPQTSDPRGLSAGREVSLIDAIAQSVGFMGPVFSIALLVPLVAGANPAASGAGVAAPLSVLLAVVGAFAIAWIVAAHARRADRPGSLHDQIGTALGAPLGAASGLLHLAGVIVLGAGLVVKIGGSIFDVLDQEFALTPLTQTTWMLVVLVLLALMLSLNLKVTTRVLLVLVTVSVLVVLLFVLNVIVRAGGQNDVVTAFSPSSSPQGIGGVLLGLLYAVPLLFLGLESAVGLGAETTHPERDLPRAVLVAVAVVGTLAVLGSYAQVVGYELNLDMITDNRDAPLFGLAAPAQDGGYGSEAIGRALRVVVLLDLLAVLLAVSVSATRGLFRQGRDRRLPAALGRPSDGGIPIAAGVVVVVVDLFAVVAGKFWVGLFAQRGVPHYDALFRWAFAFGAFAIIVTYLLLCLGAPRALAGHPRRWAVLLATVIGVPVSAGALFTGIYRVPAPVAWAPWAALGVLGAALLAGLLIPAAPVRTGAQGPSGPQGSPGSDQVRPVGPG